jgi:phosphate transport system permease protein
MNFNTYKRLSDRLFKLFGLMITLSGLLILGIFLFQIAQKGLSRVDWQFLTSLPSRFPEKAGIYTALMGTLWIMFLTALFAIPVGVMAAVYLEEYARRNRWGRILEINISNLAGVPSIIYGILGLEVFSRTLGLGNSLLTGSLTLALLVLPIIIVSTREALRAVPASLREASYALGATKWQTVYRIVLPTALGNILTGVILALSRAVGEAAPLIVAGALVYVPFAPSSPMDNYSVLPIQIFNWISRPQLAFETNAAAGILILLAFTFLMNGTAVLYRNKLQKKNNW